MALCIKPLKSWVLVAKIHIMMKNGKCKVIAKLRLEMEQNLLLFMGALVYCFNKHLHEEKHM